MWYNTSPLPNSCQAKSIIYQTNNVCGIVAYKQKRYLGSCEATFKEGFGNYKKTFNHSKNKKIWNYQKNSSKLKNEMEHQKLRGK